MYKRLYYLGFGAYIIMLVLSILYYKERIIFVDTAFMIFHIVRTGFFCIELHRFGDAIVQTLPLLAYKLHSSLGTISMSYSLGFILFYLACYIVCGSVLRQYRYAIVILLVNLLFASDTFYWPMSQVPQGMALYMVVFASLSDKKIDGIKPLRWLLVALALIILAFFHPLMLFALGYSIVFFMLGKEPVIDKKVMYTISSFFILILIVKSVFFRTQYETHSLSGLRNFIKLFPDYFTTYANREFLKNCITKYYWIPVTFTAVAVCYKRAAEYKKLALLIISVLGYLMLANIMYPSSVTPLFYIENIYLPLALFLGLPVVFDLLPLLEQKKIGLVFILLIMFTGCLRIYATHRTYTARLDWERNFLVKNGNKKIVADAAKANAGILQMLWCTPYEFWLLSTIEQNRSASIIIDNDPAWRPWVVDQKKSLVVNYNIYPYAQLNPQYFRFTDTTSGYIIDTSKP